MENIVRKGEITCNKQFLLFSQCFLSYMALIFHLNCTLKMSSTICFNLGQSKILSSGNGLINKLAKFSTESKAFTVNRLNVGQVTIFVFDSTQNLVEKENYCWLPVLS